MSNNYDDYEDFEDLLKRTIELKKEISSKEKEKEKISKFGTGSKEKKSEDTQELKTSYQLTANLNKTIQNLERLYSTREKSKKSSFKKIKKKKKKLEQERNKKKKKIKEAEETKKKLEGRIQPIILYEETLPEPKNEKEKLEAEDDYKNALSLIKNNLWKRAKNNIKFEKCQKEFDEYDDCSRNMKEILDDENDIDRDLMILNNRISKNKFIQKLKERDTIKLRQKDKAGVLEPREKLLYTFLEDPNSEYVKSKTTRGVKDLLVINKEKESCGNSVNKYYNSVMNTTEDLSVQTKKVSISMFLIILIIFGITSLILFITSLFGAISIGIIVSLVIVLSIIGYYYYANADLLKGTYLINEIDELKVVLPEDIQKYIKSDKEEISKEEINEEEKELFKKRNKAIQKLNNKQLKEFFLITDPEIINNPSQIERIIQKNKVYNQIITDVEDKWDTLSKAAKYKVISTIEGLVNVPIEEKLKNK